MNFKLEQLIFRKQNVFTDDECKFLINEYLDYLDGFDMFHSVLRDSLVYSHMIRLLKYEVGTKIHPHTDHDPFVYGSCTFNLSDDYTGGELSFWKGKHDLKLKKGESVIWPADYFWVHEVKEIISGVRYSTNSFILSEPLPFTKEVNSFLHKVWEAEKDGKGLYAKEIALKYKIRK